MMKTLDDSQIAQFDVEYVTDRLWKPLSEYISLKFPDGKFRFIDIGGGNGLFADRILLNYPEAHGTVLDNSEYILLKNAPHPRKQTILGSVESVEKLVDHKFDLVFFNWVLHHLVSDGYKQTHLNIINSLAKAAALCTPKGYISVLENLYEGFIFDNFPSHAIFHLTSMRSLAKFLQSQGANTAGTGVCFQSQNSWLRIFAKSGLELEHFSGDDWWQVVPKWRLLGIKGIRVGNFWLKAAKVST